MSCIEYPSSPANNDNNEMMSSVTAVILTVETFTSSGDIAPELKAGGVVHNLVRADLKIPDDTELELVQVSFKDEVAFGSPDRPLDQWMKCPGANGDEAGPLRQKVKEFKIEASRVSASRRYFYASDPLCTTAEIGGLLGRVNISKVINKYGPKFSIIDVDSDAPRGSPKWDDVMTVEDDVALIGSTYRNGLRPGSPAAAIPKKKAIFIHYTANHAFKNISKDNDVTPIFSVANERISAKTGAASALSVEKVVKIFPTDPNAKPMNVTNENFYALREAITYTVNEHVLGEGRGTYDVVIINVGGLQGMALSLGTQVLTRHQVLPTIILTDSVNISGLMHYNARIMDPID